MKSIHPGRKKNTDVPLQKALKQRIKKTAQHKTSHFFTKMSIRDIWEIMTVIKTRELVTISDGVLRQ